MQIYTNPSKTVRCYDLSIRVNVHNLRPDFHRIRQGARANWHLVDGPDAMAPEESIYPNLKLLPGHGHTAVKKALEAFASMKPNGGATNILVKAQRNVAVGVGTTVKVHALTDHGTNCDFRYIGILCVSREGMTGGSLSWKNGEFVQLRPGDMAVYDGHMTSVEVTNVTAQEEESYIDFLVFFAMHQPPIQQ
jgi:hypothetical protein